jgi:DnaK suppressor protein
MSKKADLNFEKLKTFLLDHRDEILRDEAQTEESRKPVTLDQTSVGRLSRMDALQNQAMALETERRRILDLKRIDAALKRLEGGDYGYCVNCGDEISPKRLEFDPAIPTCIDCASKT